MCYPLVMGKDGDNDLDVHVTVEGEVIVATLPCTTFRIVYRKADEPWLLASDVRDDPSSSIGKHTFRARAHVAANDKARELGWIV